MVSIENVSIDFVFRSACVADWIHRVEDGLTDSTATGKCKLKLFVCSSSTVQNSIMYLSKKDITHYLKKTHLKI
jgi:hypothetical protein